MRTWRTYVAATLVLSVAALLDGSAQAASPKTDAAKIANAMSAAPAALSRNSSVAEMNEDGSIKELRQGTNGWTCVPDDPSTPGNDPMCLDPNAMEWLHAYMKKEPPPEKVGFIYMLQGGWDFSNLDPMRPSRTRESRRSLVRTLWSSALRSSQSLATTARGMARMSKFHT